jgi:uncharacterized protein YndB with AHSA1/START domain
MKNTNTDIEINVRERILKPVGEVFDAVIDPAKLSKYFISCASGPIKRGPVTWEFGDFGAKVTINVLEVQTNKKIVWESTALGQPTRTTIEFVPDRKGITLVTITEGHYAFTPDGVKLALGQNAGWTHTLCGLKAFVQFGINLRAGLNQRLTDTSKRRCAAPKIANKRNL